jgi:hypothetical protein
MLQRSFLLLAGMAILISCKKEESVPEASPTTEITVTVNHFVNQEALVFDKVTYTNAAGNTYTVNRLEYYLTNFAFKLGDGTTVNVSNGPNHVDAEFPDNLFTLTGIPITSIEGVSFMIGLTSTENYTGSLEDNLANLNMAWPESLDGGYHFLKLEGHYTDDQGLIQGFTVHLGNNGNQSIISLPLTSFNISASGTDTLVLDMNINEWFENPNLYDFNKQGSYTMAIDSLMRIVSENGNHSFKAQVK